MKKRLRISIDFDGTLDKASVQRYVLSLIERGYEVWIVTSRDSEKLGDPSYNDDLFEVAKQLGIPRNQIKFTNQELKYLFFKEHDFYIHLDDYHVEIKRINQETKTIGLSMRGQWINKFERLLKNKENET